MHTYYDIKEMLHRELSEFTRKGEVSMNNLEIIDKLLNSIKNADKIIMYEEYADSGYSYDGGYSNARGRGQNAKRDSLGRYAREGGYPRDGGYSSDGDYPNRRDYSRDSGYSYASGEDKMQMLREMLNEANSPEEKEMIKSLIQHMNK